MHGLGVYTWKIGDKYIGEVNYGRIHGFGTYTWRTNSKCAAVVVVPYTWRTNSKCATVVVAAADAAVVRGAVVVAQSHGPVEGGRLS